MKQQNDGRNWQEQRPSRDNEEGGGNRSGERPQGAGPRREGGGPPGRGRAGAGESGGWQSPGRGRRDFGSSGRGRDDFRGGAYPRREGGPSGDRDGRPGGYRSRDENRPQRSDWEDRPQRPRRFESSSEPRSNYNPRFSGERSFRSEGRGEQWAFAPQPRAHQKMRAWQEGVELAKSIYELTTTFPASEQAGLGLQLRQTAVVIPSRIADAAAQTGGSRFNTILANAMGALGELETQLLIAQSLGMVSDISSQQAKVDTLYALIHGLLPRPGISRGE